MTPKDHFAHKAASFDGNPYRVDNVAQIAACLGREIALAPTMRLLDFGAGTGLLLERIAPQVGHITAVDVSPAMNEQLRGKLPLPCPVDIVAIDLEQHTLAQRFDGIISSMTLHHIRDVAALLHKFTTLLNPGGFIALADLDREDGSFHSEDTGVFHHGFDRPTLAAQASSAGFHEVRTHDASVIRKGERDFPVFLLTARL